MSSPPPQTPWALRDLARLVRFEGVGLVAIVATFVGARHTHTWDRQLYWVVGAMAGMVVSGIGWVVWLLVATRKLRQRQRRLAALTAAIRVRDLAQEEADRLVTAPRMTHFHRPGCVFVEGRAVTSATAVEHLDGGLRPCPVCLG